MFILQPQLTPHAPGVPSHTVLATLSKERLIFLWNLKYWATKCSAGMTWESTKILSGLYTWSAAPELDLPSTLPFPSTNGPLEDLPEDCPFPRALLTHLLKTQALVLY